VHVEPPSPVLQSFAQLGQVQECRLCSAGMSIARTWYLRSSNGEFALRFHPGRPQPRQQWQLGILNSLGSSSLLPRPYPADLFHLLKYYRRGYYVLTDWKPSTTTLATEPTQENMLSAVRALAQTHLLLRPIMVPDPSQELPGRLPLGPPPGLRSRQSLLYRTLLAIEQKQAAVAAYSGAAEIKEFALRTLARVQQHGPKLLLALNSVIENDYYRFPCLRDMQPEHVLFAGPTVTGIVDPWAMRFDCAAADLSRLVVNFRLQQPAWYANAIATYSELVPFSMDEQPLLEWYDLSLRLLSGVNWLEWLIIEPRQFRDHSTVLQRLQWIDGLCREQGW
jgi:hypothetical protein